MRAARVGQDTALAQIVALVETAQLAKAPIQAFADHVCAVFVPVVVVLAVVTWNAWCANYVMLLCGDFALVVACRRAHLRLPV